MCQSISINVKVDIDHVSLSCVTQSYLWYALIHEMYSVSLGLCDCLQDHAWTNVGGVYFIEMLCNILLKSSIGYVYVNALCIWVRLAHDKSIFMIEKVRNEGMVEDECHLLFTCLTYSSIRSRYADILRGEW